MRSVQAKEAEEKSKEEKVISFKGQVGNYQSAPCFFVEVPDA